ncbi:MAG: gp58-like family protein [Tissierellaceae bacterium]|nr:gp58-like family protein [Tissierellaceae bacterium]
MANVILPGVYEGMSNEEIVIVVGKMKKTLDWLLNNLDLTNMPEVGGVIEDIQGNYSAISQTVDEISLYVGDMTGSEAGIIIAAGGITSYVSELSGDFSLLEQTVGGISSTVSSLDTTVGQHTSSISQMAGEISSIVSFTDVTGNQVVSKINQTATTVEISASRIDLTGITTIYSGNKSSQAVMGGTYGDFTLKYGNNIFFNIHNDITGMTMNSYGTNVLAYDDGWEETWPLGTWDFYDCDVLGLDVGVDMRYIVESYYYANKCYLDLDTITDRIAVRDRYGDFIGHIDVY